MTARGDATARRDGAAGQGGGAAMRVATLSGNVGTPTAISDQRRVNDDGVPYYLANVIIDGETVVAAIHAAKAWRVREYLATTGATV